MESLKNKLERLIFPLVDTYAMRHAPLPRIERIDVADMPQPSRDLLAHDDDMTPTLEKFHRHPIALRILRERHDGDGYLRQVVLVLKSSGRPVEFGAIQIHLDRFAEAPRREILDGEQPLGTILGAHAVPHVNHPSAFLRVAPEAVITQALRLTQGETLYCRCNTITDPEGRPMAEIVEILSPPNHRADGSA